VRWARCPGCGAPLDEVAPGCDACGTDLSRELLPLVAGRPPGAHPHRAVHAHIPSRRSLLALTSVLAATVLVAAMLAGGDQRGELAAPSSGPAALSPGPPTDLPDGWGWQPVGPLRGRHGQVVVWTGSELVIWGGDRPGGFPTGAAYDPASEGWRLVAPGLLENRSGAAAVWTGREVLVWGGLSPAGYLADGAAYDPGTDRWRLVSPSPLHGRIPLAWAWTGREFLVVGKAGAGRQAGLTDAAAYDPAADTWRLLQPVPIRLNEGVGAWTGRELVVYGGLLDGARRPIGHDDRAKGAALDPKTGQWRLLPPAPLSEQAIAAAWNGQQLVAWDYRRRAAAFDPATNLWSELLDLPVDRGDCLPAGVAAGRRVFADHCGQMALFDPDKGYWRRLRIPKGVSGQPVWTGDHLLFWLGPTDRPTDGTWSVTVEN
jgi:hypothetical protein